MKEMNICILGGGRVGGTLAKRWASNGHAVSLVVRDKKNAKSLELVNTTTAILFDNSELAKAFGEAEVIVNALPWSEVEKMLKPFAESLAGKIILDATNPIKLGADEVKDGLLIGHTTSAGEQVKEFAPQAIVIKGLNTVGWEIMENPEIIPHQPVAFICGDDAGKTVVSNLISELGLKPCDVGSIKEARLTEPVGFFWIHLCFARQWGPEFVINPIIANPSGPISELAGI
ncbi:MAG: NAD(P)-binding domain-containing protein [Leptolyngbya sp.]|nr:NAD(P)-binding domain-containing protein [Candidatus Melainabacteria bacterium]